MFAKLVTQYKLLANSNLRNFYTNKSFIKLRKFPKFGKLENSAHSANCAICCQSYSMTSFGKAHACTSSANYSILQTWTNEMYILQKLAHSANCANVIAARSTTTFRKFPKLCKVLQMMQALTNCENSATCVNFMLPDSSHIVRNIATSTTVCAGTNYANSANKSAKLYPPFKQSRKL